jgi:hypothetical protein
MYQLKRNGIKILKGKLCPIIVYKLKIIGEYAIHCLSTYVDDALFEVEGKNR